MKNMLWVVKTLSDGKEWRFETIQQAMNFYNDVLEYGDKASFPKFIG